MENSNAFSLFIEKNKDSKLVGKSCSFIYSTQPFWKMSVYTHTYITPAEMETPPISSVEIPNWMNGVTPSL